MQRITVKVTVDPRAEGLGLPKYMSAQAAGADVYAAVENELTLQSGEVALVPTGLHFEIPKGFEVQVRPRSGLALKHGVTVMNSPGTIDADYRGEVKVIMVNHGKQPFVVKRGERIAQLVVHEVAQAKFEVVEKLEESARGQSGFGSSGKT
ncbi:MAG: dUTP diphosphatase [Candidatus Micrarchaeia archaeon]